METNHIPEPHRLGFWMGANPTHVLRGKRINDSYLHLRPAFDTAVSALKKKIADAAYTDGMLSR